MATSLLICLPLALCAADAREPRSDVGNFFPMFEDYAGRSAFPLSYLAQDWPDADAWRRQGRDRMHELLSYDPVPSAPNAEILETVKKNGYTCHLVRYNIAADRATEAFLLIPDGLDAPAPAVVALHCHSGFYYYGKEKITGTENPVQALQDLINGTYGGRPFADELVRHGFVVLVPDAFYFGAQRLDVTQIPSHFAAQLRDKEPGTNDYVQLFNPVAARHEDLMAKTMFAAGTTWPGILFQGDRASVDYLVTRPEVDPGRIGCLGLSIGGFRSAHLFALDPRIKCGVVAGWMTTYGGLLYDHVHSHTWMVYVPRQHNFLDLPDVVTLNAPNPLMVINCLKDSLFTLEGMQAAEKKIAAVYGKMGAADRFVCNYYDEPHSLKIPAQDDAIAWLEKWLKQ
ncbi:MAG TPA: alpha/beta hydrolase family protein [Candidatus Hydrogenedentes bacterium]|mgnify:CR=1 FL=1|nr:alpha/beta hydrolase family protein [Candidatus Hydrogenedentota bacterium]HQE83658.1 alpha/beta hydrolase family protein [Candidatus Hydrogenedentota bacterium]HQH52752.1 alpha/beta hydrolase family protein [Candidatus Hydrogenedentota bacterium]HQM49796.1 alpha/beta hydrolase family protein [Candidatus Hydrogenedentota bacterium]